MSNTILVFTGAGASFQFNKPTTKEFKLQLSKKYKGSELMESFLDCPGFEDIEHVLESLKDFELAYNSYLMKYLKNAKLPGIQADTRGFFTKLNQERDNIRSDIMYDLFLTYKWNESEDDEPASKFYGQLFDIISKYSTKIYVGTTNYDQAIEQACSLSNLKYECIDGFEYDRGDISKWNGKKFTEEFNGQGKPVYLYKVHGSLNWKDDGTRNIVKNNRDISYDRGSGLNILIAPTLSPKTAQEKEPYSTLLSELKSKLEKADVCIVIGFSFRDKHIGDAFQKFIQAGKDFIVISPSCNINYCDNLFEQKFNSSEARVAWLRKHRNGKKLHFIDERVEENNNGKVFQKLEEVLKSIGGGIKEEIDSQPIRNYSCDITFDELEEGDSEKAKTGAMEKAQNFLDSLKSNSIGEIKNIEIEGRGPAIEIPMKDGIIKITLPEIPAHTSIEGCQFALMHMQNPTFESVNKILTENNLMYWDFKWELTYELDVNSLISKIQELTGKRPFSSGNTRQENRVGADASYSLPSIEGLKVATTISGVTNGPYSISATCIQRTPKRGFYKAHQILSPGKIVSYLLGEIPYTTAKEWIEKST